MAIMLQEKLRSSRKNIPLFKTKTKNLKKNEPIWALFQDFEPFMGSQDPNPDPHQSDKQDPNMDPRQSDKQDPYPHQCDAVPQYWIILL